MPDELRVWASHGDFVQDRAPGLHRHGDERQRAGRGDGAPSDRRLYALLFHPEVAHTDRGLDILRNFAYDVCGCTGDWTMASFVEEATERIRAQVGDGRVVCGLSGGVDSTVAALLIHRADRRSADLHLRRQRRDAARRSGADPARGSSGCSCRSCSSTPSPLFLDRLAGVTDPEQKRKIIGATFIDVFEAEAAEARARSTSSRRARSIPT